jgi:hypothetical protein
LTYFFYLHQDFEKIQREEPLDLPPMPPQKRNWKGGLVAPFASNNMLVLYQCPGKTGDNGMSQGQNSSYFVQVLHNEAPVSMPVRLYVCNSLSFIHWPFLFPIVNSEVFNAPYSMVTSFVSFTNRLVGPLGSLMFEPTNRSSERVLINLMSWSKTCSSWPF